MAAIFYECNVAGEHATEQLLADGRTVVYRNVPTFVSVVGETRRVLDPAVQAIFAGMRVDAGGPNVWTVVNPRSPAIDHDAVVLAGRANGPPDA